MKIGILSALEYRLLLVFFNNSRTIITRDRILGELRDASGEFVSADAYGLLFVLFTKARYKCIAHISE